MTVHPALKVNRWKCVTDTSSGKATVPSESLSSPFLLLLLLLKNILVTIAIRSILASCYSSCCLDNINLLTFLLFNSPFPFISQ